MDIKIINENPPFLLKLITAGMNPQRDTIFPYNPVIYNPSGLDIPADIMIHEAVHIKQQGKNPQAWWDRYILDKGFRLQQELEANQEQYKFICKIKKDRNERARALVAIARNMAGAVYGNMITTNKAIEEIKKLTTF